MARIWPFWPKIVTGPANRAISALTIFIFHDVEEQPYHVKQHAQGLSDSFCIRAQFAHVFFPRT